MSCSRTSCSKLQVSWSSRGPSKAFKQFLCHHHSHAINFLKSLLEVQCPNFLAQIICLEQSVNRRLHLVCHVLPSHFLLPTIGLYQSTVQECPSVQHSNNTDCKIYFSEPIGGSFPKFSSELDGSKLTRAAMSVINLNCPAQAFPVPSFR